MDKTLTINIGGTQFTIEQTAYERLQEYLASIKEYFAPYPDQEEIVSDIEARAAEHFMQNNGANAIITNRQIDELIAVMGKVEDFAVNDEVSADNSAATNSKARKRLLRNSDDMVIAGVCSGIAAYLNVDPLIVRILWVLSLFAGGGGIIAYIIFWILMPLAKTPQDKLQMRGDPLNLSALRKDLKEEIAHNTKPETISALRRFLANSVSFIGAVIRTAIPFLLSFIGAIIAFASIAGMMALIFIVGNLTFNRSPYIDFPFAQVASQPVYYSVIILAFILALIPLIFVLMIALSLIRRRIVLSYASGFGLAGTWLIAVMVIGFIGVRVGPDYANRIQQLPEYRQVTTSSNLTNFTSLDVYGIDKVTIQQGDTFAITAEGREMSIDHLTFSVKDGVLKIEEEQYNQKACIFCHGYGDVSVTITMPAVQSITAHGSVDVYTKLITADTLTIDTENSSSISGMVNVQKLVITGTNSSVIELEGTASEIALTLNNSSRFECSELVTKAASITAKNSSRVYINATDTLNVTASNSSSVTYYGSPKVTQSLSSSARLTPVEKTDPLNPVEINHNN